MVFEDREKAFEKKFEHDEQLRFRAESRRNRKLASWACELMGLTGEEVEKYRTALQAADFEEAGDEDVFRKLRENLTASGVEISDHQLRGKIDECFSQAITELKEE